MNWEDLLTITGPIVALLGWTYIRLDKRFDKLDMRIDRVEEKLQNLDSRVARIEGQLNRPYWEPELHKKEK